MGRISLSSSLLEASKPWPKRLTGMFERSPSPVPSATSIAKAGAAAVAEFNDTVEPSKYGSTIGVRCFDADAGENMADLEADESIRSRLLAAESSRSKLFTGED